MEYDFEIEEIKSLNKMRPENTAKQRRNSVCAFCEVDTRVKGKYHRASLRHHYTHCKEVREFVAKKWSETKMKDFQAIKKDGDGMKCNFCYEILEVKLTPCSSDETYCTLHTPLFNFERK